MQVWKEDYWFSEHRTPRRRSSLTLTGIAAAQKILTARSGTLILFQLHGSSVAVLLSELDHRVKNILAIVASVVSQTLKTSLTPAAFAAAIDRRIAAIARAHSMLGNQGDGGKTSLRDLVTTELEPYNRDDYNISVDGVTIVVTPRAGLSLALAIHELASNAAKYGALSRPSGRLTVSWTVDQASPRLLSFVWAESGGPPIEEPPAQRGFGTTLIERTLTHQFDAEVHRDFLRSGLRCTIKLPLTAEVGEIDPPG